MKRMQQIKWAALALVPLLATGCQHEDTRRPVYGEASIGIEIHPVTEETSCSVTFTPSEGTASYEVYCAIGADAGKFKAGDYASEPNFQRIEGNEVQNVTFENLKDGYYTVLAVGYDADGMQGAVAEARAYVPYGRFSATPFYVADTVAGFVVYIPDRIHSIEYYVGKEGEKQAFENGEVEKVVKENRTIQYSPNISGLEPATDYVFYVRGIDRIDTPTETIEIPFTTCAAGECPSVSFEVTGNDVYRQDLRLAANDKVGKVNALVCTVGEHNAIIENDANFRGDIVTFIQNWIDGGLKPEQFFTAKGSLDIAHNTPDLACGVDYEVYAVVYDTDMNPAGVQHFNFRTKDFNPDALPATATISIGDIDSEGAMYTIEMGENTLAVLFDTAEAWWYETMSGGDYGEFYIHQYLLEQGYYFAYSGTSTTAKFEETACNPGQEYYVLCAPMNENGPLEDNGWGELAVESYTTTAAR